MSALNTKSIFGLNSWLHCHGPLSINRFRLPMDFDLFCLHVISSFYVSYKVIMHISWVCVTYFSETVSLTSVKLTLLFPGFIGLRERKELDKPNWTCFKKQIFSSYVWKNYIGWHSAWLVQTLRNERSNKFINLCLSGVIFIIEKVTPSHPPTTPYVYW